MKKNAIIRIIIFSVIAVLLIGLLITGILFSRVPFRYFHNHTDNYVHGWDEDRDWDDDWDDQIVGGSVSSTGSVASTQVSELEIQWVAGSITIVPGDTEQIEFSESGNEEKPMVWKQVGNKLLIQFCENQPRVYFGFRFNDYSKDLVVTVPKDWAAREVQIDAVSARVDVSDLTMTEVEVNSVSGICEFRNCTVGSFSVETVSGDVNFSGSLGELECNAVSADCTVVTSQVPREISMESMSGDIELTLPEDAGFTVEMENLKGDLNTDFAVKKLGKIYSYGDGSCRIELDALSGDVTIHKLVPKA